MLLSLLPRYSTFFVLSLITVASLVTTIGCGSDSDDGSTVPIGLSVSLTLPLDGSTVTGTAVGVRATVAGDRPASSAWPTQSRAAAASVSFYIDDALIGTKTDSPYFLEWNSSTVPNGQKTLKAVATNGDQTAEDTATVIVSNEGGGVAVVIVPASVQLGAGATQNFSAQVIGADNQSVNWAVDGGATNGTITSSGLYTAPATLPSNNSATIRATSVADGGATGTATVLFDRGGGGQITVSVTPPTGSVEVGATLQLSASVSGTANTTVNWTVTGGATNGTVTSGGLYTAPNSVPNPSQVRVRATSAADPSAFGEAVVTITGGGGPIPADELELLIGTYLAGFNLQSTIGEVNQFVFQAVLFASCTTGQATVTGSVTENPPGSGQFEYSNTPNDRLVVTLNSVSYDVRVTSLETDESSIDCEDWRSIDRAHGAQYTIEGPNVALGVVSARFPKDSTTNNVDQIVQGAVLLDGRTWEVNGQIQGQESFFIDTGGEGYSLTSDNYSFSGTLTSGTTSVTIAQDQSYEFQTSGSSSTSNETNSVRNQGTNGSVSFSFSGLSYGWVDSNRIDRIYKGSGTILRNGAAFGNFVVDSASGAAGIQLQGGAIVPF